MAVNQLRRAYIDGEVVFLEPADASTSVKFFKGLIAFANRKPGRDGSVPAPQRDPFGLFQDDHCAEYYSDIADAHSLARNCLADIAQSRRKARKAKRKLKSNFHLLSPDTSKVLTRYLQLHTEQIKRTVEKGRLRSWRRIEVPTSASACAFVLARLIEEGKADNIGQCRVSECGKFFWAPVRRGPRPDYCCVEHSYRGSKRIARGGNP